MQSHRNQIRNVLVGDDDAAGVLARIADHPFDHAALLNDNLCDGIVSYLSRKLWGLFDRIVERNVQLVGNHFCDFVGFGVFELIDSGEVTHNHLCAKRAEGDNVCDAVFAVFFTHIVYHLVAAAHAEIDVEVGRRDTF